ncbi:hypothetical protein EAG_15859 [Camponotus floridanus]|uniref:Uncharacterized protein n=1 Tax=Camponotus floridanus TaxID=104421 RepID=E2ACN6_CAMFO|nr:hypothetical protein EAG_15859 [Camponotus floridanus]
MVDPPLPYVYVASAPLDEAKDSATRTEASARPGWSPSYANRAYVEPESYVLRTTSSVLTIHNSEVLFL